MPDKLGSLARLESVRPVFRPLQPHLALHLEEQRPADLTLTTSLDPQRVDLLMVQVGVLAQRVLYELGLVDRFVLRHALHLVEVGEDEWCTADELYHPR